MENIINRKFGRLLVMRPCLETGIYECICDCGRVAKTSRNSLLGGGTRSCGCLASQLSKERSKISENDYPTIVYEYISSDKSTLESIGTNYGVSRERIRQIISLFGNIKKYRPINKNISKKERKENKKLYNFWKQVDIKSKNECWMWLGNTNPISDYGIFAGGIKNKNKEERYTHRLSYLLFYGNIPDKAWILHTCDNPACVNPLHLYIGNAKLNAEDRENRSRGNHKVLSKQQRQDIYNSDKSIGELSSTFNVSKSSIIKVKKNKLFS